MEQSVKKVFELRGEGYRTKLPQPQLPEFPPHRRRRKVSNAVRRFLSSILAYRHMTEVTLPNAYHIKETAVFGNPEPVDITKRYLQE